MTPLHGIIQNGQIIITEPISWPNGTEIEIRAVETHSEENEQMTEANWPTSPEAIERLIQRMDSREPLIWEPGEYESWLEARKLHREWEKESELQRDERLHEGWK